jgi:ribosomal protein L11 methyltransferase
MRWLELSVTADVEAVEAVSEILGRVATGTAVHPTALVRDPNDELVARPDVEEPFVVVGHVPDGPEATGQIDATERALWHLQAFGLRPLGDLQVRHVDDADWSERWREHYTVQRIGRVVIVPSWVDHAMADGDLVIRMDPGMAFGTGLHPTTRGCLELLQEVGPMPDRVLDVGCGSGILALAALRLGAAAAVGIDTDPAAVAATLANAERNGFDGRVQASHGTLPEDPPLRHPLVLANLVAAVLVELSGRLAAHLADDGVLLVGGIIAPREAEVVAAMAGAGLESDDGLRRSDGEWVSLGLRHAR